MSTHCCLQLWKGVEKEERVGGDPPRRGRASSWVGVSRKALSLVTAYRCVFNGRLAGRPWDGESAQGGETFN